MNLSYLILTSLLLLLNSYSFSEEELPEDLRGEKGFISPSNVYYSMSGDSSSGGKKLVKKMICLNESFDVLKVGNVIKYKITKKIDDCTGDLETTAIEFISAEKEAFSSLNCYYLINQDIRKDIKLPFKKPKLISGSYDLSKFTKEDQGVKLKELLHLSFNGSSYKIKRDLKSEILRVYKNDVEFDYIGGTLRSDCKLDWKGCAGYIKLIKAQDMNGDGILDFFFESVPWGSKFGETLLVLSKKPKALDFTRLFTFGC